MQRRNFFRLGLGALAAGSFISKAYNAKALDAPEGRQAVRRAGTPGGPEIPGGEWRPERFHPLTAGPGYNHPRNRLDGAVRDGIGPHKDISPVYTARKLPGDDEVDWKTFHIDIVIGEHEYLEGVRVHLLMFNNQNPGPELRVNEGDWVKVVFRNKTDLMHTIHWHGLIVPYEMDGVPFTTQPPVLPNQQFVYRFQAHPFGTKFYHCHFSTPLHQAHAMHGAIIIESERDPVRQMFPYERDYVLVLAANDTILARTGLSSMLTRMQQRIWLFMNNKLTKRIIGVFRDYSELKEEIRAGYLAAYLTARNETLSPRPNYNFFTINGKSYPATETMKIKPGEWIRVRMINGSFLNHFFHLHGHDFYEVAIDGAPLAHPIQRNTMHIGAGQTKDIVIYGNNPGIWSFHDHNTIRTTNNGIYPGGMFTFLEYEGFVGGYVPLAATFE